MDENISYYRTLIISPGYGSAGEILENLKKKYIGKSIFLPKIFSLESFWQYLSPYLFCENEKILHITYYITSKYLTKKKSYEEAYNIVQKTINDVKLIYQKCLTIDDLKKNFIQDGDITFEIFMEIYNELDLTLIDRKIFYKDFFLKEILKDGIYNPEFEKNIDKITLINPFSLSKLEIEVFKKISQEKDFSIQWQNNYDFLYNHWNKVSDQYSSLSEDKFWQIPASEKKALLSQIEIVNYESTYSQLNHVADKINSEDFQNKKIAIIVDESDLAEVLISKIKNIDLVNISLSQPITSTFTYSLFTSLLDFYLENRTLPNDYFTTKSVEILFHNLNNLFNEPYKFVLKREDKSNKYIKKNKNDFPINFLDNLNLNYNITKFLLESYKGIESELGTRKISSTEASAFIKIIEKLDFWEKNIEPSENYLLTKKILIQELSQIKVPYKKKGDTIFISDIEKFNNQNYNEVIFLNLNESKYTINDNNFYFFVNKSDSKSKEAELSFHLLKIFYNTPKIYVTKNKNSSHNKIILQLENQFPENFSYKFLSSSIVYQEPRFIEVKKSTPEVQKFFAEITNEDKSLRKRISPSMINTFLDCSLKFYFLYIQKLQQKEKKESLEKMLGVHLHETLHILFSSLSNKKKASHSLQKFLTKDDFKNLDSDIKVTVDQVFKKYYLADSPLENLNGEELILKKLVEKATKKIVEHDQRKGDHVDILFLEKNFMKDLQISASNSEKFEVTIGGKIDRIEKSLEGIRIIDYKTGITNLKFQGVAELFENDDNLKNSSVLQLLIYAWLFDNSINKVSLHIFGLRDFYKGKFDTDILIKYGEKEYFPLEDFEEIRKILEENLHQTLSHLFDFKENFKQTSNKNTCLRCPFNRICN